MCTITMRPGLRGTYDTTAHLHQSSPICCELTMTTLATPTQKHQPHIPNPRTNMLFLMSAKTHAFGEMLFDRQLKP